MAFAAVLLLALVAAPPQEGAEPPFRCSLPAGYAPFAPVKDAVEAWTATARDGSGQFQVQRHLLESLGARAELVARTLRDTVWKPATAGLAEVSMVDWSGDWGGVPGAAGHTIRYARDGRGMTVIERLAVLQDTLVQFTWEGRVEAAPAALTCAESFRIPEEWIPPAPPLTDAWRGVAPGSAAVALPWRLALRVDLVAWSERGVLEVTLQAVPLDPATPAPAPDSWILPAGALALDAPPGFLRYRLDPRGDPAALARWGLVVSTQSDLAACDASWVAAPNPGAGSWLPPAWELEVVHPGHMMLLGPQPAAPALDAAAQSAVTRFHCESGRAWPFFLAGRFQKRVLAGLVWNLRLDAQARTPDEAAAVLQKLAAALTAWLPEALGAWSLASFPGAGDRALPGLFVLDETRGWFDQPADGQLAGASRRAWLARLATSACFGARLHGSGSGAPVMEAALAEYAAARVLEQAGWPKDAAALRASWEAAETRAGPLPLPLTLLPPEEVFGAGRLLSRGALVWSALEGLAGRARLDAILAAAVARAAPWSTEDLVGALPAAVRARAAEILYGTGPL